MFETGYRLIFRFLVGGWLVFYLGGCGGEGAGLLVDTVFVNGHVVTMDEGRPVAEALAVRGGRIVAVGSTVEIESTFFYPERVDLRGRTVMPGIIESQSHLPAPGERILEFKVTGVDMQEGLLKGYTIKASNRDLEEEVKGLIKEGMLADFIVVSDDILRIPAEEFLDVVVEKIYVGGVLVYERRVGDG